MQLNIHFQKHGYKFGLKTAAEYEQMADTFMFGMMNADTRECNRPGKKRRCRLEFTAVHFGVAQRIPAFLLSFYPPAASMIAKHGGLNGFFTFECARNP
jgi:hypothetical protein